MRKKAIIFMLILLVSSGIVTTLSAQRQTGSIFGKVTEVDGSPLPGASVTLNGPSLMGSLAFTTTEEGDFRFPAVPPGSDYVIKVEMPSFKTVNREGIIVQVGKTIGITIKLEQTSLEEEVTVTASTPLVDVKSGKLSVNYSEDTLNNIPVSRDYHDIILTAPGMVDPDEWFQFRVFSSHGSGVRSNLVAIDGVNMMTPDLGVHRTGFSFDTFDEIEMEMGAHPAEVGLIDGAYVNIVTKSGGNEFHGQATVFYFNDSMTKGLIPEEEASAVGLTKPTGFKNFGEISFSLGGYIIKDRWWFFINGRYVDWNRETENAVDGVYEFGRDEIMSLAKFTLQPHRNLKFVGMWSFNDIDEPYRTDLIDFYTAKSGISRLKHNKNHAITGMLNWVVSQNMFVDLRLNYAYVGYLFTTRPGEEDLLDIPIYIDLGTGIQYGGPWPNSFTPNTKLQFKIDGTYFADNIFGANHELKAGIDVERSTQDWEQWKTDPYIIFSLNGEPWGLGNVVPYMGYFLLSPFAVEQGGTKHHNTTRRFSVYFQDSVTIKNRLTLNLGLRYDETRGDAVGDNWDTGHSDDPVLSMLAPQIYAQTYSNLERKNVLVWKDLSPRIGAAFDVLGDGSTSLKASWSRYNMYMLMMYFFYSNPFNLNYPEYLWFDFNMDGVIDASDGFLNLFMPKPPDESVPEDYTDPDLKAPYTDEFIIGIERELFRDLRVGVSYIYKKSKRLVDDVEKFRGYTPDSGWWVPYTVSEPGWDGLYGTSDDKEITVYGVKNGAPPSNLWVTNLSNGERKYQALEFIVDKRMSNRWQFFGSLVLSRFEGNQNATYWATGAMDTAFNTPNWNVNRYGRIDLDRPVQIKLQGSVLLPYDFMLSGYFNHLSGAPWARTLRIFFPLDDPRFDPTNSPYEDVNAEAPGERRRKSRNFLDLRLEKIFNISDFGRLGIFLDVLNVLGENWYHIEQDPGGWILPDGSFLQYPQYGLHTSANGLRTFKVSARFTF